MICPKRWPKRPTAFSPKVAVQDARSTGGLHRMAAVCEDFCCCGCLRSIPPSMCICDKADLPRSRHVVLQSIRRLRRSMSAPSLESSRALLRLGVDAGLFCRLGSRFAASHTPAIPPLDGWTEPVL